jgi:hypothetical protein
MVKKNPPFDRKGSLMLPNFAPRRGGHCESSALLNALDFLGYGLSEADIVGGGAAPSFLFTDEAFPFLGSRNEKMRETFFAAARIPYRVLLPEKANGGWEGICALLERGRPVVLRVDMRYLPYLYGGRRGPAYMSFGWHWVCLAGLDFDSREALVTDTAREGLQRVGFSDLDAARFSATRVYPPRGEYAWAEPRPPEWRLDPDALAEAGLSGVLKNYQGEGGWGADGGAKDTGRLEGLGGLALLPERLGSLDRWLNVHTLAPAYRYIAGSIERNGTGGGAFRLLYARFLEARAGDCRDEGLRAACSRLVPAVRAAAAAWTALAARLDAGAARLESARGPAAQKAAASDAGEEAAEAARAVYAAELALQQALAAAR